jgi:hypothetical protein
VAQGALVPEDLLDLSVDGTGDERPYDGRHRVEPGVREPRVRDTALTPDERSRAIVLTGNYGGASAVEFFGTEFGLPPAASGHMNYYLWNLPMADPAAVIAYGLPARTLNTIFEEVVLVGQIDHPLAHPKERQLPVYRCRRPRRPLREVWPSLRRYGNTEPQERAEPRRSTATARLSSTKGSVRNAGARLYTVRNQRLSRSASRVAYDGSWKVCVSRLAPSSADRTCTARP